MALGKTKARLERAKAILERAKGAVPQGRGKSFHEAIEHVSRDVREALVKVFPDSTHVDEICEQAEQLQAVADPLGELVGEAMGVEGKVEPLRKRGAESCSSAIAESIANRCSAWLTSLKGVGRGIESLADLEADQTKGKHSEIAQIQTEILHHDRAIDKLDEAEDLIQLLGHNPITAGLENSLTGLHQTLINQGADPSWLKRLEEQLAPVRKEASKPPPQPAAPPPGLRAMRALLPEAEQWIQALQADRDSLDRLIVELRLLEQNQDLWQTSELGRLHEAFRAEVKKYRDLAIGNRESDLEWLSECARHYTTACEEEPSLEDQLTALRNLRVEDVDSSSRWRDRYHETRNSFEALAQTRITELKQYCDSQAAELRVRVEDVLKIEITSETRDRLDSVERRIEQIERARGRDPILQALRECGSIQLELIEIKRQAEIDLARHNRDKQALQDRSKTLEEAILKTALPINGPGTFRDKDGPDLDRSSILAFSAELDRIEQQFVQLCHFRIGEDTEVCVKASQALKSVPGLPAPAWAGVEEKPKTLAAATEACLRMRALRDGHANALEQAAALLGSRIAGFRKHLGDFATGATEDLQEIQDLVDRIDSGLYHDEPDPVEKVVALGSLCDRCDNFFWRMDKHEREAKDKHARLRRRLRAFYDYDLHHYFPAYSNRVAALLHGMPQTPRDWTAVNTQMDEAEHILQQLEPQAKRVAAAQLDAACKLLKERLPRSRPAERQEMEQALEGIERSGDEFPAAMARRTLLQLAEKLARA